MKIKGQVRRFAQKLGYDIIRFDMMSSSLARRRSLFERFAINLVFDVGANEGQFGDHLRKDILYGGRIVSFEPASKPFSMLKTRVAHDSKWRAVNVALGDGEYQSEINVSSNSQSSSFLNLLPSHAHAAPESQYVGKEIVAVTTLDKLFGQYYRGGDHVFMKIDAQGFEKKILQGSERVLDRIASVQLEMSLLPLYENGPTSDEILSYMYQRGYTLVFLEPIYFTENALEILQVDAIFHHDVA